MKSVWQYGLAITRNEQHIPMPRGAKLLTFQLQNGMPYLWMEVDTDARREDRVFRMVGTGWDWSERDHGRMGYIGTVQIDGFVWHYYERLEAAA